MVINLRIPRLIVAINGRDAMPDGGKITIETANAYLDEAYAASHNEVTSGQYVMVAVSDTGTGMSHEEIERAFEPFFTTKPIGKGSGLGLSQVYGFIKQSKGHVKIYSELGSGTTVKFYMPRAVSSGDARAEAAAAHSVISRARDGELILIVDDDHDVLIYTKHALQSLGYTIIAAQEVSAALSALGSEPAIALLLTDVELPEMSGSELVEVVLLRRPGLPVLFMTGYPMNAIVHRGLLDRDATAISKPFNLAELAKAVQDAVNRKPGGSPGAPG